MLKSLPLIGLFFYCFHIQAAGLSISPNAFYHSFESYESIFVGKLTDRHIKLWSKKGKLLIEGKDQWPEKPYPKDKILPSLVPGGREIRIPSGRSSDHLYSVDGKITCTELLWGIKINGKSRFNWKEHIGSMCPHYPREAAEGEEYIWLLRRDKKNKRNTTLLNKDVFLPIFREIIALKKQQPDLLLKKEKMIFTIENLLNQNSLSVPDLAVKLAISESADQAGFTKLSHFNRQLKKLKKCSPRNYRKHFSKTEFYFNFNLDAKLSKTFTKFSRW